VPQAIVWRFPCPASEACHLKSGLQLAKGTEARHARCRHRSPSEVVVSGQISSEDQRLSVFITDTNKNKILNNFCSKECITHLLEGEILGESWSLERLAGRLDTGESTQRQGAKGLELLKCRAGILFYE
jgi:hypothetical protein